MRSKKRDPSLLLIFPEFLPPVLFSSSFPWYSILTVNFCYFCTPFHCSVLFFLSHFCFVLVFHFCSISFLRIDIFLLCLVLCSSLSFLSPLPFPCVSVCLPFSYSSLFSSSLSCLPLSSLCLVRSMYCNVSLAQ